MFGRFLLVDRLAAGGMAEVYASRPLRTNRMPNVVAIKRMLPEVAARSDFVEMFVDEAKLVSRLDHENIVRSYEYGREAGAYYIAMEMLCGLDMSRVAALMAHRERQFPPEIAAWIAEQVCAGLAHAHALEDDDGKPVALIHRDVTPHNVILGFDGIVKIIDFGIAKSQIQRSQTSVGVLKGKVCYMSPEQATRGARIDHRSDIYSVGVCLWEWLAGRRMFSPEVHYLKTLKKVCAGKFEPIGDLRSGLPDELVGILDKALAQEPEDRFQSAEEMRQALESYRSPRVSKPERSLRRWLDRELADQRLIHEQRLEMIATTPVAEGTIPYHVALDTEVEESSANEAAPSFVEATTEVFFSIDVELTDDTGAMIGSGPTDHDVRLPYWSEGSGVTRRDVPRVRLGDEEEPLEGMATRVDKSSRGRARGEVASEKDREVAASRTGAAFPAPPAIDIDMPRSSRGEPRSTRRDGVHPGLALAGAVVAAAIVGVAVFYAQQPPAATNSDEGVVQVRLAMDVEGATVFVDGQERGGAPLTLGAVSAGAHEIRVVADGYEDVVEQVEIVSGTTTIVAASMARIPELTSEADASADSDDEELAAEPESDEPPQVSAEESERLAAEERRAEAQARWARLQETRERRARRAARAEAAGAEAAGAEQASPTADEASPEAPTEAPPEPAAEAPPSADTNAEAETQ